MGDCLNIPRAQKIKVLPRSLACELYTGTCPITMLQKLISDLNLSQRSDIGEAAAF